jgi:type IV secretory pathway TraG/TraD family ATPase VirD4
MIAQMRVRQDRAVVFDLTGAYVEAFYNPETDTILNPMDERCPSWSLFDEGKNYADFTAIASAILPTDGGGSDPFWMLGARTLFVQTCVQLMKLGQATNAALAYRLMMADLEEVHELLRNTIAEPLTAPVAARMAESVRAVLNTNAQALLFIPEGKEPFSICDWVRHQDKPGSILFITSSHNELVLNRALLSLWMNLAVHTLMRLPRTRSLRTWFFFDEVHALHRLPAIEDGLQTARGFGGAFVLGIHSFAKLAETYGKEGAQNLASLARTKLILAAADRDTAEHCSDYIGHREVRMMDEAYSYGYSNIRDAATITPRSEVQPLVIPDDIMRLPSLRGFLVFPEGFDAARIRLTYKDYPKVAEGYILRENVEPIEFISMPKGDDEDAETGGRDRSGEPELGQRGEDLGRDPAAPLSPALEPDANAPEIMPDGPNPDPSVGKQMAFRLEQAPQNERTNGREQDPTQKAEKSSASKPAAQRTLGSRELNDPALPDKESERGTKAAKGIEDPSHSRDDGPEL